MEKMTVTTFKLMSEKLMEDKRRNTIWNIAGSPDLLLKNEPYLPIDTLFTDEIYTIYQ